MFCLILGPSLRRSTRAFAQEVLCILYCTVEKMVVASSLNPVPGPMIIAHSHWLINEVTTNPMLSQQLRIYNQLQAKSRA